MKRTKRMAIVTIVAVLAISVSLMSTAFAAPANCPLKSGIPAGTTAKTYPAKNLLGNDPGNGTTPAALPTGNCPKSEMLNQLLQKLGMNKVAGTTSNCTGGDGQTNGCTSVNSAKSACPGGGCIANMLPVGGCNKTPACQR